jgi:methionine-gamma-lyase
MTRTKDDNQRAESHGLSRRDMLAGLGGSAAMLSITQLAGAEAPAKSANTATEAKSGGDLLDDRYKSKSGNQFGSQVIHHGEMAGYNVTPISQDKASPNYQRPGNMSNPTVAPLLKKMMEAEGTQSAVGAPCGMGAISQTYLALLKPGDRLVTHRCNYDWVMTLFGQYLRSLGIEVEFLDFTKPENLAASLKAKPAKIVHWEPYVNPTMEVLDSPALIDIAKKAGALVILDNTWLTPYLFQPARLGADLVIHSVTKYVGGHGNAMGGVVSGRKDLIGKIGRAQSWLGGLIRPMDAFLITQGIKTLPIRMRQHCQSAQQVAEFLQAHPAVARVRYGGLTSWNKLDFLKGFGGMLGVEWKKASVHKQFGRHIKLIINKTSLGDPVTRINNRNPEKNRGIPGNYTRVSIGLEEPEDIIADFRQAIAKCR